MFSRPLPPKPRSVGFDNFKLKVSWSSDGQKTLKKFWKKLHYCFWSHLAQTRALFNFTECFVEMVQVLWLLFEISLKLNRKQVSKNLKNFFTYVFEAIASKAKVSWPQSRQMQSHLKVEWRKKLKKFWKNSHMCFWGRLFRILASLNPLMSCRDCSKSFQGYFFSL